MSISPICLACTEAKLSYFGRKGAYRYYRCGACGALQLLPMPDAQTMKNAYAREYVESGHCQAAPVVRNKAAKPQFDALVDCLLAQGKSSHVLDYGPGWGGLLLALRESGIVAEGAELARSMADYCKNQGFRIHRADLSDLGGEARYDAIMMSSVFEHLVDHSAWLNAAQRLLKPEGLIISLQPTAQFATLLGNLGRLGMKSRELPRLHQIFWPPWHTVLFSRAGMEALFDRHGFELLEIRPAPLQRESGFTGFLQRSLSLVNNLAHPLFGNAWPLWVGHIFVFRKKN